MTYQKFIEAWYDTVLPDKDPQIRMGQSLMNYLCEVWVVEYNRIVMGNYQTEGIIDCFYVDSVIPKTMTHLEKVWHKYPL